MKSRLPATWYPMKTGFHYTQSKMADDSEVEIRGVKRPLVENYSDEEEEEEARIKEGETKISMITL